MIVKFLSSKYVILLTLSFICSTINAMQVNNNTSNLNKIDIINISNNNIYENKVKISQEERDKFLENYKKYPVLSSLNACLQMTSLVKDQELISSADTYFNQEEILTNLYQIVDLCNTNSIEYSTNNTVLLNTIIWGVIDEYIRKLNELSDRRIKHIIYQILNSIKKRITDDILQTEPEYDKQITARMNKINNTNNVIENNIKAMKDILNTKSNLYSIRQVINNNMQEVTKTIRPFLIKSNIKSIYKALNSRASSFTDIKDTIKDNLDVIEETLKELIFNRKQTIKSYKKYLITLRNNKAYIENTMKNEAYTTQLVRQVQSKIKEYNLYNVINKIIKGVNYIVDLNENKINVQNDDNKYVQPIYTLSNNNNKCWLISAWELVRTILAHEYIKNGALPDDLRNSNFVRFDRYLCNKSIDNNRKIITDKTNKNELPNVNVKFFKEYNYDKYYNAIKRNDLTVDRTGKSNVYGGRIDLLSELILWDAKNKWIGNITEQDKQRRTETIELLQQLQDINYSGYVYHGFFIILNIFPELKKHIGNKLDIENNNNDVIQEHANEFIDNLNNEFKSKNDSFLNNNNTFQFVDKIYTSKTNKKSNFVDKNKKQIFKRYKNYDFSNAAIISIDDYEYNINNTSPYLILSCNNATVNDIVHGNKFISSYDDNGKLNVYELIGMNLSNSAHVVTFVKKGSADNSWCGIDSNRNANDNNYKLEDILYNKELVHYIYSKDKHDNEQLGKSNMNKLVQETSKSNIGKKIKSKPERVDNNTYLAKVYANKESDINKNNKRIDPYYATQLLYKKIL